MIHVSFELSNGTVQATMDLLGGAQPLVGDQIVLPNETFHWTVKKRRWGFFDGEIVLVVTIA